MKYIRTEDNIQAFNDGCDLQYVYLSIGGIKIADTIEELCDEFIIDCKSNIKHKPFIYTLPKKIKEYYNSLKIVKKDTIVYGAIWTDRGLKYVAKLNEKGEFELLGKD